MTDETVQALHHKYGPSQLEHYNPRTGGCSAFMPKDESNEKAEFGTLKHLALSTRDLSVLEGDPRAEAEVSRVMEYIDSTRSEYPIIHTELTLKIEKIFGTLDHLGLDEAQKKAIIVDAKFGAWSVTPAKRNLQGIAYVVLAFHNFPTVNKIKIVFYAAKTGLRSEHTFWRGRLPDLEKRIYKIIDEAERVEKNPTLQDYRPNAVNCSFCTRLNCPARLALMGTLVTVWAQKPVELPHLDLLQVSTPQLADLKRLSNVFKAFSAAVDSEARRRALDNGEDIPGYEIVERNGTRTVVGANNITEASKVLANEWDTLFPTLPQAWGNYILDNTELTVGSLEKAVGKAAPYGKAAIAKKIIVEALEKAGLINSNKIFSLQAIKE